MRARPLFLAALLLLGSGVAVPAARAQVVPPVPAPPPTPPLPVLPPEVSALLATGSPSVWTACSAATSVAFLLTVGAAVANPAGIPIPSDVSAVLAATGAYVSTASTPCYVFPQPSRAQVCGSDADLAAIPFVVVTPGAMVVSQLAAVEQAIAAAGVPAGAPVSQAVAAALTCKVAAPPVRPPDEPTAAGQPGPSDVAGADADREPSTAGSGGLPVDGTARSLVDASGSAAPTTPAQPGTDVVAVAPLTGTTAPTAPGSPVRAVLAALAVFVGLLVLSHRMGSRPV